MCDYGSVSEVTVQVGSWNQRANLTPHVTPQSEPPEWEPGPTVLTSACLGLSFHIRAMWVTIPALLVARSSCESVGVAAACGKP